MRLVLASQSPRRRELLESAGFSFTVSPSQISEILDENLNLGPRIEDLALRKAQALLASLNPSNQQGILILAADTVVAIDDRILGKPSDQTENLSFLRQMSGRDHVVITAVCLVNGTSGEVEVGHAVSRIKFRQLSDAEMSTYVSSRDGLDKAGGYGIQGEAGKFVEHLDGDFDNVMGLPIALVKSLLAKRGWTIDKMKSPSARGNS